MWFAKKCELETIKADMAKCVLCLDTQERCIVAQGKRIAALEGLLSDAEEMMRAEREMMAQRDNLYSYTGREQGQVKGDV